MKPQPKVVICGSFRKGTPELKKLYLELEHSGCRILAPISIDFEDLEQGFVKSKSEQEFSIAELERFYLRAIEEADFIWLHAPEGYVGLAGSFELGYAYCLGKTVYCRTKLQDATLDCFIKPQVSVFESLHDWAV